MLKEIMMYGSLSLVALFFLGVLIIKIRVFINDIKNYKESPDVFENPFITKEKVKDFAKVIGTMGFIIVAALGVIVIIGSIVYGGYRIN